MANVAHASLTGSNLHEPKGVASAASGTVYIADGAGSGAWSSSTSIATGMIADFVTPIAPTGWLELDGSAIVIANEPTLYAAMTIQQTGSRGSGSAIITGLSSTTHMRAGYYVFGTGIASGTQILSVDSSTQITMNANASSSGSATVIVSPWLVAATTITLPDVSTAARYRRSRSATVHMGVSQADQNKAHTHTITGSTGAGGDHSHGGATGATAPSVSNSQFVGSSSGITDGGTAVTFPVNATTFSATVASHTHSITASGTHTHTLPSATDSSGSTEVRPISLVVMTCVKT